MTPETLRPHPIRVLVVDDSAVTRSLLRMVLDPHPEIEVAGAAADGKEAITVFESLHPDLVLLDVAMPGMNGLDALSAIRLRDRRVPVIMCSTLTWRGAQVTLDALSRGATDYVAKPSGESIRSCMEALARELIPKILALVPAEPGAAPSEAPAVALPPACGAPRVVVVGASTGGPAALEALLPKLPASFPLPILIVQHMPRLFTGLLAERLDDLCALHVREAVDGARVEPGVVELARGDWHLELACDLRLRLDQSPPENFCRPSVDVLFRSAAAACAGRLLGVILTGMGTDGLAGCRAIRNAGGTVIAQDSLTSVIWGMPGAVASAGLASHVLPLDAIPAEIQRCIAARPRRAEAAVV